MFVAVGMMVYEAEEAKHWQNKAHYDHQQYLVCSDLFPDPHCLMPWQGLYQLQNDRDYITTMGFDVTTFDYIWSPVSLSTGVPTQSHAVTTLTRPSHYFFAILWMRLIGWDWYYITLHPQYLTSA
jgi:hypothetical protein